jgi:hypothetical protein
MERVRAESEKSCVLADSIASDFPDLDLPNVTERCKDLFAQMEAAFSPADKLKHLLTALKQTVQLVSEINQFASIRSTSLPRLDQPVCLD